LKLLHFSIRWKRFRSNDLPLRRDEEGGDAIRIRPLKSLISSHDVERGREHISTERIGRDD